VAVAEEESAPAAEESAPAPQAEFEAPAVEAALLEASIVEGEYTAQVQVSSSSRSLQG
jgi:dihydroxyacetone kinase DhaKLM complex PTS-EIIA-like component DhaM